LAGYGSYCNFQVLASEKAEGKGEGEGDGGRGGPCAGKGEQVREGKERDGDGDGGGGVELDKDIEALRAGMPDRGVWLAGEHTAPFVALGTVTGAWWSGEGVAMRIAAAYGVGSGQRQGQEQGDGGAGL